MSIFAMITILIVLSALFGYINTKYLKMPSTIGMMLISLLATVGIVFIGSYTDCCLQSATNFVNSIDFRSILLDIMLSMLLFAGALHTDMKLLKKHRAPIFLFATFGVVLSAFITGTAFYYLMQLIGVNIKYIHALLFGSLIAPTDPIAVLGVLKQAKAPKNLEIKIVGESLFNDGVGVVLFLSLVTVAGTGVENIDAQDTSIFFVTEVFGGIILGGIFGYIAYLMMKSINNYETEVMITLALATGTYVLANSFHLSGPLAVVVAGFFIGNTARRSAFSEITERYIDKFWELLDVFLNAVLFVLIGMEIIVLTLEVEYIIAGLIAIPITLLARFTALTLPVKIYKHKLEFVKNTALILTWGGLRGGISIALALSLTNAMNRDLILTATYIVVLFSILFQGLTLKGLIKRTLKSKTPK